MAAAKRITLITGANGGLGYGLAKLLLADSSQHVLLGARNPTKGQKAVSDLQALNQPGTVELLEVDVDSYDSIQAAAQKVTATHGRIDALVNNAAIAILGAEIPLHKQMEATFRTNCIGVQIMTDAFAPLLSQSTTTPRIIHVSSGAGSIERRLDPSSSMYKQQHIQYRSSKAALNMISACHAVEYGEKGWKVFAFCPGFTVSNLSGMNTAENGAKPTEDGARPMVGILKGERDEEHGRFLHADGQYPF